MRILIRTSKWAIWARRLGSFALPLALLPVLMHRGGMIPTETFGIIEAVAVTVALLALAASVGAFIRIWVTGDRGWGKVAAGLLLSLVCLAPPLLLAVDFVRYPMTADVTTDAAAPPLLLSPVPMATGASMDAARLALAFPNVKTRNYRLPPDRVFAIASGLVGGRGWDILSAVEPGGPADGGQINAIATTLLGFRDEVSIRLTADGDGTSVAMRSASLTPLYEPGVNGSRIEGFLTALDANITRLKLGQPAGDEDGDDDALDPNPTPTPLPAPAPGARRP